jgi:hypothetical protein
MCFRRRYRATLALSTAERCQSTVGTTKKVASNKINFFEKGSAKHMKKKQRFLPALAGGLLLVVAIGSFLGFQAFSKHTPAKAAGINAGTAFGVDTVSTITPSFLSSITNTYGKPGVIERYLNYNNLSDSEVAYIHSQGIRVLVTMSDPSGSQDIGRSAGVAWANQALSYVHALNMPTGRVVFSDIENGTPIDAPWIGGWVDTLVKAGYFPGFYENSTNGPFKGAFCSAQRSNSNVLNDSILFSAEPDYGTASASQAPNGGAIPSGADTLCSNNALFAASGWQYGLAAGNSVNVDTDEFTESLLLSKAW